MLDNFRLPTVPQRRHFMQNKRPPHVSFPARAWLDNYYSGSTRRKGQAELPSRSTVINPCDLLLRGWVKQKVIRSRPKHLTNWNNFEMILLLLNLTFIRSVMGLRFPGCRILCKMLRCMLMCDTKWCSNLSNTDTAICRRVFATILRTSEQENDVLLGTVGNCDLCCTKRPNYLNYRRKTYFQAIKLTTQYNIMQGPCSI
jgi:hypothetical protein